MTWRKAGFALYSNSLEYRKILDQNLEWSVMETPPPGTVLNKKISNNYDPASNNYDPLFYPFDTSEEYYSSLSRYSTLALAEVERLNGWTASSDKVVTNL